MKQQNTYSVRVTVGGRDLGIFDKMSGGEVDSDGATYRPGGLGEQQAFGGPVKTGNVTVQKLYDEPIHGLYHWLVQVCGQALGNVTKQPLVNGAPFGRPLVYDVRLKSVKAPDVDNEGAAVAYLELEFEVNGRPS